MLFLLLSTIKRIISCLITILIFLCIVFSVLTNDTNVAIMMYIDERQQIIINKCLICLLKINNECKKIHKTYIESTEHALYYKVTKAVLARQ